MKKIDKKANRPLNSIGAVSDPSLKERLAGAISDMEIKKLKKLLKSEPKSLWKYLLKKEN